MVAAYLVSVVVIFLIFIRISVKENANISNGSGYLTLADLGLSIVVSILPVINILILLMYAIRAGDKIVIWRVK